MKKTSRIVNVSRGGIINEKDLSKALKDGLINGAAIDVFTKEPIDENNPLIDSPNILLTPHLGASTEEAKEGVSVSICQQMKNYLIDEKLDNAINMPFSDLSSLKDLQPSLDLSETIGRIQSQLNKGVIKKFKLNAQVL